MCVPFLSHYHFPLLYKATSADTTRVYGIPVQEDGQQAMSVGFPEAGPERGASLPAAQDVCLFLTTELATAQTTQNEEVEQKQSQLVQLQVK